MDDPLTRPGDLVAAARGLVAELRLLARDLDAEVGPLGDWFAPLTRRATALLDSAGWGYTAPDGPDRALRDDLRAAGERYDAVVVKALREMFLAAAHPQAYLDLERVLDALDDLATRVAARLDAAAPPAGPAELHRAVVVCDLVNSTKLVGQAWRLFGRVLSLRPDSFPDPEAEARAWVVEKLAEHVRVALRRSAPGAEADAGDHVIASTGDGVVLQFDTVGRAVRFAAELHAAAAAVNDVMKWPWPVGAARPEDPVPFAYRVAVASGALRAADAGGPPAARFAGPPLTEAARLSAAAPAGGLVVSAAALAELGGAANPAPAGDRVFTQEQVSAMLAE